jgi:predicted Zn-ribbon and HTH transcriptional regulator
MENKEKIIKVLKNSNEPLKAGEIAELAEIEKKEVDKGLKTLKNEDKIFSPKRCFYSAK